MVIKQREDEEKQVVLFVNVKSKMVKQQLRGGIDPIEKLMHLSENFLGKSKVGGYIVAKGCVFIMGSIDYLINASGHRLSTGKI